ncbi:MAG TPA: site-specific integrase [Blastocatellia bacterium]|nr:site-specific integrase [Blastocatellia bacterium]HMZ17386.1 site-specific integrase [Blastocatellia bacterium]HNG29242.1 site-specific integrase [Blastocatellia bacterium]
MTIGGRRFRRGQFLYKKDAEDAAAALRTFAQRTAYGLPTNTPERTLSELKAHLDGDNVPPRVCWMLGLFAAYLGEQKSIREISRADIKRFADQLQAERSLTAASYAYYLNALRAGLNRAGDYFAEFETWRPPKFPKAPTPSHRERIVSQGEIAAVLKVLAEDSWKHDHPGTAKLRRDLHDIIRLMLLTGARREEIEKLTSFSINEKEMTLNLVSSKTNKRHTIPLSQSALKILKGRPAIKSGKLFASPLLTSTVSRTMSRAAAKAEIAFGQKEAWTLHDLRRTASVIVENAGLPYSAVQELLGHSRADMTARYTPAQMQTLRQAVTILENWCREIDGFFEAGISHHRSPATPNKSAIA